MSSNLVLKNQNADTICATATAVGVGALGIIRLSGTEAISIANKIFNGKNLEKCTTHTVQYGNIINPNTNEIIDEVMVSIFHAPRTFTKENLVEISCHGSNYIQQQILNLLIANGARLAKAGEFTQRAFLHGRIDLSQAEAVADLIASENSASHQIALNQMRGGVSNELQKLRDTLIHFTALIELELDFGEEDVEFADRQALFALCTELQQKIQALIQTFAYGNAIKNGMPVAIIGKPNAGKSSLLNRLLNEERAIVSAIAGTTRDTIEEICTIQGIAFRFIDTAGLRQTPDEIEKMGIAKAREKMKHATIIIYLFDKSDTTIEEIVADLTSLPKGKIVLLCPSKIDLYPTENWQDWETKLKNQSSLFTNLIGISAKETANNISVLKNALIQNIKGNTTENEVIITNTRHLEALQKAQEALQEVENGLQKHISGDFLSYGLKDALRHLGTITGAVELDRDILGAIFGKFCIGK